MSLSPPLFHIPEIKLGCFVHMTSSCSMYLVRNRIASDTFGCVSSPSIISELCELRHINLAKTQFPYLSYVDTKYTCWDFIVNSE